VTHASAIAERAGEESGPVSEPEVLARPHRDWLCYHLRVSGDPVLCFEAWKGPLDLLLELARTQWADLARISVTALGARFVAVLGAANARRAVPLSRLAPNGPCWRPARGYRARPAASACAGRSGGCPVAAQRPGQHPARRARA
jgi:hypothetical protein